MSSVLPMLSLALCLLLSPPVAGWNTAAQLSRGRTVSSSRSRPVFALADPAAKDAPADSSFDFGEEKELKPKTEAALSADEAELGKMDEMTEQQKEIARLKAAEKFMKKDTGDAVCRTCGYKYRMTEGDGYIPRLTPFQMLPESYTCINCKSPKAFFDPVQIEIAGFEDNQSYGIGTNTWTESQKSTAIFGGLGFAFLLLMSGYALN